MNYRLITSKEGMDYLDSLHKSPQDFSATYRLKSNYGVIYELENGELLLIHPIGIGQYPGFLFSNVSEFLKYRDADFFPIGTENMTWLESNADNVANFTIQDDFFLNPLREILKLKVPFSNVSECESGYNDLVSYIRKKKNPEKEKQNLANCYALAMAKFLIDKKGFSVIFRKEYEVYNPYYLPILSNEEKQNVNVVSKLYTALGSGRAVPFRDFYWYLTGTPTHVKID